MSVHIHGQDVCGVRGRGNALDEPLGPERNNGAPAIREVAELVAALHGRALACCPNDAADLKESHQLTSVALGKSDAERTSIAPTATNVMAHSTASASCGARSACCR